MASVEGAGWLVAGRSPVYDDALLDVVGKEMLVLLFVCCQGPPIGILIATL